MRIVQRIDNDFIVFCIGMCIMLCVVFAIAAITYIAKLYLNSMC